MNNQMMRNGPPTTITSGKVALPNPQNGSSGQVGGAAVAGYTGVRRDFTYTPLFQAGLTTNGQTGVPRG